MIQMIFITHWTVHLTEDHAAIKTAAANRMKGAERPASVLMPAVISKDAFRNSFIALNVRINCACDASSSYENYEILVPRKNVNSGDCRHNRC